MPYRTVPYGRIAVCCTLEHSSQHVRTNGRTTSGDNRCSRPFEGIAQTTVCAVHLAPSLYYARTHARTHSIDPIHPATTDSIDACFLPSFLAWFGRVGDHERDGGSPPPVEYSPYSPHSPHRTPANDER
mmetsp:Transcript_2291/g.4812  ORF Transcript_2291/g.4812 Transcript_2291/m.4812 type:complete len:129 (+) Transcript_2291:164-550(+)